MMAVPRASRIVLPPLVELRLESGVSEYLATLKAYSLYAFVSGSLKLLVRTHYTRVALLSGPRGTHGIRLSRSRLSVSED